MMDPSQKSLRQFTLRTLMLVVSVTGIVLGFWRAFGITVLVGTCLGVLLACGVAAVVARITHSRRWPFVGALIGVLVAHVVVAHVYCLMPNTDIRNWSIIEYLFYAFCGAVSGACVAARRSVNVVSSLVAGAALGGSVSIAIVSLAMLLTRSGELMRDPQQFFSAAMMFIPLLAVVGLALGGVTGCLTGLIRYWFHIRSGPRKAT
jgi:hypothetical protein